MPLARLKQLFDKLYSFPTMIGDITVLWHAGEPCVLPPSYYEEAISLIEQTRPKWIKFDYSLVTNGTLLDDSWLPLLQRQNVRMGLSIDGPRVMHDSRRKTRNGRGTFDSAIRGLKLLRDHDIPFYVITVLAPQFLGNWHEYADFCIEYGITNIGFNIDELEGHNAETSFADPSLVNGFKTFLRGFLLRASQSEGQIANIRELSSAFSRMSMAASENPEFLNEQTEPFSIISISTDGGLSTFSPELLTSEHPKYGNFIFGNVFTDSFEAIVGNAKFQTVSDAIGRGVENCARTCAYFRVCRGGAPSNKIFETGVFDSTETVFCRLTQKAVLDVALELTETFVPASEAVVEA